MDCCNVFPHNFSILFFYFSKLYLSIFFNMELIENLVLYFFSFKHRWLLQCFSARFFFIIFSEIIFFLFYFLILSWLKITVTICEEITLTFLENYCWLLQCFFPHGFFLFCYFFSQIFFVNFIFSILSWLRIAIISKYKFFLTKHYGLIQFFITWFFFSFFCVFFFVIFFSKIIFVDFFLILCWLEFNFVIKLNHVGKAL